MIFLKDCVKIYTWDVEKCYMREKDFVENTYLI